MGKDVVALSAVRSAIGSFGGALNGIEPHELAGQVMKSAIARAGVSPDAIQYAPALPKTRSGKIMRRILRKIASGDTTNLGDTSTLADPGVVEKLLEEKQSLSLTA